jgi:hypothetical protein
MEDVAEDVLRFHLYLFWVTFGTHFRRSRSSGILLIWNTTDTARARTDNSAKSRIFFDNLNRNICFQNPIARMVAPHR